MQSIFMILQRFYICRRSWKRFWK